MNRIQKLIAKGTDPAVTPAERALFLAKAAELREAEAKEGAALYKKMKRKNAMKYGRLR